MNRDEVIAIAHRSGKASSHFIYVHHAQTTACQQEAPVDCKNSATHVGGTTLYE